MASVVWKMNSKVIPLPIQYTLHFKCPEVQRHILKTLLLVDHHKYVKYQSVTCRHYLTVLYFTCWLPTAMNDRHSLFIMEEETAILSLEGIPNFLICCCPSEKAQAWSHLSWSTSTFGMRCLGNGLYDIQTMNQFNIKKYVVFTDLIVNV